MKLKLMFGASMLALCAMSVMAKSKPMVSQKDIVEFAAATVTKADVMVKNGLIHVIDAVVMPN
jgi:uncharacterized surface protein with fasciclin (FAS1) repeats